MPETTSAYRAPALEKGLQILQTLANARIPLTLKEIANRMERTPNELFRMLSVLEREAYVHRDELSGRYRLGLRLYALAMAVSPYDEIRRTVAEAMREFVAATDEGCHVSVLDDGKLVVLAEEAGPSPVRLSVPAGSVHDPRNTLSGRLLLQECLPEERERHLSRAAVHFADSNVVTWKMLTSKKTHPVMEARNIRLAGVLDCAVLVPIPGTSGCVVACSVLEKLASTKIQKIRDSLAGIYLDISNGNVSEIKGRDELD